MQQNRLVALALVAALVGGACSGDAGSQTADPGTVVTSTTTTTVPVAAPQITTTTVAEPDLSPLAGLVESRGDIRFDLNAPLPDPGPRPVGLSIDAIGVTDAAILDVGVEPNGEMEIPGAAEVGWYRWSPTPGQTGSSVLAAHIAFNGRDGVFRNLDDLAVGDRFTVRYEDGTEREFAITETAQYDKEQLPFDRVFAKEGDPSVVLITCGGDFNRSASSYDDNVVRYAEPV